jgi:hypothetical protein
VYLSEEKVALVCISSPSHLVYLRKSLDLCKVGAKEPTTFGGLVNLSYSLRL